MRYQKKTVRHTIRMQPALKKKLTLKGKKQNRSLSAEILYRLEKSLESEK